MMILKMIKRTTTKAMMIDIIMKKVNKTGSLRNTQHTNIYIELHRKLRTSGNSASYIIFLLRCFVTGKVNAGWKDVEPNNSAGAKQRQETQRSQYYLEIYN